MDRKSKIIHLNVRMPEWLHRDLKRSAKRADHSLQKEVIARLGVDAPKDGCLTEEELRRLLA